jgi:hypothetical protein
VVLLEPDDPDPEEPDPAPEAPPDPQFAVVWFSRQVS